MAAPIQNNPLATSGITQTQPMIEKHGAFRGQHVTNSGLDSSAISSAKLMGSRGIHSNLANLANRILKQGQAATMAATPRIIDYFDKLPNMPQMEALQSLVESLQSYMEETSPYDDQTAQNLANSDEDAALTPFDLEEASKRRRLQNQLESGTSGGGGADKDADDTQEGRAGIGGVFKALQEFDPDVTHQFAALDIAREYFEAAGVPSAFQELLGSAAQAFETPELQRDIRAGFASAQVARDKAETLETSPAVVRETYRAMIREEKNFGQLFDQLTRFDVFGKLDVTIDTFQQAAGRDLSSLSGPSSCDPRFLQELLQELGKLKRIKSVLASCQDLTVKLGRLFGPVAAALLEPKQIASRVLNFAAKATVGLADAKALLGPVAQSSAANQVALANGLRELHAAIPDDIPPSKPARLQQVTMLTSLQNLLVAAEQDEFVAARAGAKTS